MRWYITPWSKYDRSNPPRWTKWTKRFFNIYLHFIRHDDDDRALHDHPWSSCSWILDGCYWETVFVDQGRSMETKKIFRPQGSVTTRQAHIAHRLVLERHWSGPSMPAISLFFTGGVVRAWGFWCSLERWVPWQKFVSVDNRGSIGRGCE
jgi:hypothetical protein